MSIALTIDRLILHLPSPNPGNESMRRTPGPIGEPTPKAHILSMEKTGGGPQAQSWSQGWVVERRALCQVGVGSSLCVFYSQIQRLAVGIR